MKTYKLWVHKADLSEADLVINQEVFPNLKAGDLLEVYHPGDDFSRLLLQIGPVALKGGVISIQENVAKLFQLRSHREVVVNKVNKKAVTLDHVELLFKDQYISRNDMWRMRESLVNTCVYQTKKLNFCGIRAQVRALYSSNIKVMCGMISENTRIVYRSASAAMLILIQMSYEMWEFDREGDLYFETAVNGFFMELINNWKEESCYHDVTVALFSRTFYQAEEVERMPRSFKARLQQNRSDMYEDFYTVVVDSETRLDWSGLLVQLKKAFHDYKRSVNCHADSKPRGYNSSAMEGNVVEAINLGLDVYCRHYVDRNFERTGQQVVVVTPGVGLFKTGREIATLTKVRVINSCIGADMICLAEQPLHAVPLFIVTSPDADTPVQYDIPHWINHSFYRSQHSDRTSAFIPCMRIPSQFSQAGCKSGFDDEANGKSKEPSLDVSQAAPVDVGVIGRFDYDEYDSRVFAYHPNADKHEFNRRRFLSNDSVVDSSFGDSSLSHAPSDLVDALTSPMHDLHHSSDSLNLLSHTPQQLKVHSFNERRSSPHARSQVGASTLPGSLPRNITRSRTEKDVASLSKPAQKASITQRFKLQAKPFVNPFSPDMCAPQRTANVFRWHHTFPFDEEGKPCRDHHSNLEPRHRTLTNVSANSSSHDLTNRQMPEKVSQACQVAVEARLRDRVAVQDDELNLSTFVEGDIPHKKSRTTLFLSEQQPKQTTTMAYAKMKASQKKDSSTFRTDSHFEEVTVDWKSLCTPACLPITTGFFPDHLHEDYVEALYTLYYDDDQWAEESRSADAVREAGGHPDLSLKQIFRELLLQRLGQDFQLIVSKKEGAMTDLRLENGVEMQMRTVYWVTLGRHFHCLHLEPPIIHVTRYKPRHPYEAHPMSYSYRLCRADSSLFERRWAKFSHPNLDEYNWNYLDQYVCGDRSFANLLDSLKYWRCRFLLLPIQAGSSLANTPRRGSTPSTPEEHIRAFVRFIELLNRIRRPGTSKKERFVCPSVNMKSATALAGGLSTSQVSLDVAMPAPTHGVSPGHSSATTPDEVTESASAHEIWRAMQSKQGVELLEGVKELPSRCFMALDAVDWLLDRLPWLSRRQEATDIMQRVLDEGYIEHASGDQSQGFVDGTYIYRLLTADEQTDRKAKQSGGLLQTPETSVSALERFQNLWYEVLLEEPHPKEKEEQHSKYASRSETPHIDGTGEGWQQRSFYYLNSAQLDYRGELSASMKSMVLQSHAHGKSDRPEWCAVHYSSVYRPSCVFNFNVHWMVATACLVRDAMVQSWTRKAASCGFTLLPAPANPIRATQEHPFRCVQFVPLCLGDVLDEEEKEHASLSDVLSVQTRLLERLSFMPDVSSGGSATSDAELLRHNAPDVPTMVHITAVAFAQPVIELCAPDLHRKSSQLSDSEDEDEREIPSSPTGLELTEIAWHKLGFSFCHNFMLTRKWRSSSQPATGLAASNLFTELEKLCSNEDAVRSLWDALPRHELQSLDNGKPEQLDDIEQSDH